MNLYEYHTNPETLYGYKDRFKIPLFAYKEAKRTGNWLEAEPYIMKDPEYAYFYARDIRKKGRWSEAEPAIATSHVVIRYANDVINDDVTHGFKKRWKEAEPYILRDAQKSALYAIMLNTPWEEAEPIIRTSNYWWGRYESMVEDSNHTSIDELEVA